jgi:hypothetical protein
LKGNEITGNPVLILDEGRLVVFSPLTTSAGAAVDTGAVGAGVATGVGTGSDKGVDGVDVGAVLLLLLLVAVVPGVDEGRAIELRDGDC